MAPDLEALKAHADAVDALFKENLERLNALIEARSHMVRNNRSSMREMALQGLDRVIVTTEQAQSAISPYARTLRAYISEVERTK